MVVSVSVKIFETRASKFLGPYEQNLRLNCKLSVSNFDTRILQGRVNDMTFIFEVQMLFSYFFFFFFFFFGGGVVRILHTKNTWGIDRVILYLIKLDSYVNYVIKAADKHMKEYWGHQAVILLKLNTWSVKKGILLFWEAVEL